MRMSSFSTAPAKPEWNAAIVSGVSYTSGLWRCGGSWCTVQCMYCGMQARRPVFCTDVNSSVRVHSTLDGFPWVTNSPTALNVSPTLEKLWLTASEKNNLSSSATRSGTAMTGQTREDTKQEETRALQVHAHILPMMQHTANLLTLWNSSIMCVNPLYFGLFVHLQFLPFHQF